MEKQQYLVKSNVKAHRTIPLLYASDFRLKYDVGMLIPRRNNSAMSDPMLRLTALYPYYTRLIPA